MEEDNASDKKLAIESADLIINTQRPRRRYFPLGGFWIDAEKFKKRMETQAA